MALYATFSLCLALAGVSIAFGSTSGVSPSNGLVFGSGINPLKHPLPIQYVYLQLRTASNSNYTEPIHVDKDLVMEMTSPDKGRLYVMRYKHYLGDGLYLWRYRVNKEVKQLSIAITLDDKHMADSPYMLGDVLTEKCVCPSRTLEKWLTDNECRTQYDQIDSDLEPYRESGIVLEGLYERLLAEFPRSHGVHYSIIDNKIYSRTFGTIYDFRYMSDMILTSLASKAVLPDIELIVQVGDWPQDKMVAGKDPFPFLSWCGSENFRDFIWPQYDLMRSTVQGMERISLDTLMVQQSRAIPWEERIPKVFFRGRDSNQVRLDLVQKYWNQTDRFNVSLTSFFFFEYKEELYGPKAPRISQLEFFKYKYQLNIDGTVAAYRFPFLMASGSVILKQDSEYYEHYYHELKPWVHYIPLKKDISDLEEKLQWAIDHDDEAQQIAANAYQYYQDHLLPDKLYCYMYTFIKEYAKHLRGKPKVHKGMAKVTAEESPHYKAYKECQLCKLTKPGGKDEL